LREAGAISLRCHYPFSPAMMDAADELGMMVIVSNRRLAVVPAQASS